MVANKSTNRKKGVIARIMNRNNLKRMPLQITEYKFDMFLLSFLTIVALFTVNLNSDQSERNSNINRLKNEDFDVLIIGGGATGAGAALNAANRGLKIGLVERGDFASGTSSKSTKLVHGGVRYLEKAVFNLDRQQYNLVKEALFERSQLFKIAPHLVKTLEIITPIYNWWEVPYYWFGLKLYDWVAGEARLHKSEYILPSTLIEKVPHIRKEGLWGGIAYQDGQFDDARYNINLILTAAKLHVPVLNYAEVMKLIHSKDRHLIGATIKDTIGGEFFDVYAKVIINATGPYVDAIRKMDIPDVDPIIAASSGTHLLLEGDVIASSSGILVPKTQDGRVIFILPWKGGTLIGTTDHPTELTDQPLPYQNDIDYLLFYAGQYLDLEISKNSVKSVWTGIRPLINSKKDDMTSNIIREHYIEKSSSGLLTITGGKWTTYRKMAEEILNLAVQQLTPSFFVDKNLMQQLVGAEGYTPLLSRELEKKFGISPDVAEHLVSSYGGLATEILSRGQAENINKTLVDQHPMIWAEVHWILTHEMVQKPMDILSRRMRLATLDAKAAKSVLPMLIITMQQHFGWTDEIASQMRVEADVQLDKMLVGY